jgi:cyclic beta-1,2-glucan synthetase
MDFATRDRYRHVVEEIAKRSSLSEDGVAQRAIQFARDGIAHSDGDDRTTHVGFYLTSAVSSCRVSRSGQWCVTICRA